MRYRGLYGTLRKWTYRLKNGATLWLNFPPVSVLMSHVVYMTHEH